MKNILLLIAIVSIALGSCREQKTEPKEVIREVRVEKEAPEAPEAREGVLERTSKKIDKKINDKIDEKIDEID